MTQWMWDGSEDRARELLRSIAPKSKPADEEIKKVAKVLSEVYHQGWGDAYSFVPYDLWGAKRR